MGTTRWVVLGAVLWSLGALAGTGRPRLVLMELTAAGGVEPAVAEGLSEALGAQALRSGYFEVTTQKDMLTLLSLERQKQLLGCTDDAAACVAELGGALGARFVLSGSVTRLGPDTLQLNLQLLDTSRSLTVGRASRIARDLPALRGQLAWAFAEASGTPPPPAPSRVLPITLLASGGVAVVAGGVLFAQSLAREEAVLSELALAEAQPQLQLKPADSYRAEAQGVVTFRVAGAIAAGVGALALVAGLVFMPGGDSGAVALVPTGNGFAVVGGFP
jgi:TolB-like protein